MLNALGSVPVLELTTPGYLTTSMKQSPFFRSW